MGTAETKAADNYWPFLTSSSNEVTLIFTCFTIKIMIITVNSSVKTLLHTETAHRVEVCVIVY